MAKRVAKAKPAPPVPAARSGRASALLDTRIIYCGDCLDPLRKLPDACVDLIYIDPPFNSKRNYEVFWGEAKERRSFDYRHASTQAYIDYMRPRCVELARLGRRRNRANDGGERQIAPIKRCDCCVHANEVLGFTVNQTVN